MRKNSSRTFAVGLLFLLGVSGCSDPGEVLYEYSVPELQAFIENHPHHPKIEEARFRLAVFKAEQVGSVEAFVGFLKTPRNYEFAVEQSRTAHRIISHSLERWSIFDEPSHAGCGDYATYSVETIISSDTSDEIDLAFSVQSWFSNLGLTEKDNILQSPADLRISIRAEGGNTRHRYRKVAANQISVPAHPGYDNIRYYTGGWIRGSLRISDPSSEQTIIEFSGNSEPPDSGVPPSLDSKRPNAATIKSALSKSRDFDKGLGEWVYNTCGADAFVYAYLQKVLWTAFNKGDRDGHKESRFKSFDERISEAPDIAMPLLTRGAFKRDEVAIELIPKLHEPELSELILGWEGVINAWRYY